jgi:hypothetical protein
MEQEARGDHIVVRVHGVPVSEGAAEKDIVEVSTFKGQDVHEKCRKIKCFSIESKVLHVKENEFDNAGCVCENAVVSVTGN